MTQTQATYFNKVILHRGYAANSNSTNLVMENTIDAIQKGVDDGYGMFEIDVQLTRDGHVVLWHDDHVCFKDENENDATGTQKRHIWDITLDEFRTILMQSNALYREYEGAFIKWHMPPGKSPMVSTLEEVFDAFPESRLDIELKIPKGKAPDYHYRINLVQKVLDICRQRRKYFAQCMFSTFDVLTAMLLKKERQYVGLLVSPEQNLGVSDALTLVKQLHLDALICHSSLLLEAYTLSLSDDDREMIWTYGELCEDLCNKCIIDRDKDYAYLQRSSAQLSW